jgi:ketosteroid isomerase-like protein
MKQPLSLTLAFGALALFFAGSVPAQDPSQLAAVTAVDDARVQAFTNPTEKALAAVFSDDLHYAHSNGVVDTKPGFIEILTSGKSKYLAYDYVDRKFTFPAPGIALMTGRVNLKVLNAKGEADLAMSYLAVWRQEQGQWRFLAWQSCRLPAPEAK